MRTPLRLVMAVWAISSAGATALLGPSAARTLLVLPFLLVGPGVVLARLISPDDRRHRWPIALCASLALLSVVSGAFTISGRFGLVAITASIALLTLAGTALASRPADRLAVLPPLAVVRGPQAPEVSRFRHRRPVRRFEAAHTRTSAPADLQRDDPPRVFEPHPVSSPTLAERIDRRALERVR